MLYWLLALSAQQGTATRNIAISDGMVREREDFNNT